MPATRTKSRSDTPRVRPRSDAYVGLLVLALLAQIAGGVFLYLDYKEYPDAKPRKVQDRSASVQPGGPARPPQGGPINPPQGGPPQGMPPGMNPPGNPPGMPPGVPPGGQRPPGRP
jgi:hypothetical protein